MLNKVKPSESEIVHRKTSKSVSARKKKEKKRKIGAGCCARNLSIACKSFTHFLPILATVPLAFLLFFSTTEFANQFSSHKSSVISSNVVDSVKNFFSSRLHVMDTIQQAYEAKEFDQTTPLETYERIGSYAFKADSQLLALYNVKSDRQTWKLHRENSPYYSTQLRVYVNSTYTYRYDRTRHWTDPLSIYNRTLERVKFYDPFAKSWYGIGRDGDYYPSGTWVGPAFATGSDNAQDFGGIQVYMNFQTKMAYATDAGSGGYSVFKLKLRTQELSDHLAGLENMGDKGDAIIFNEDGDIVAYKDSSTQITTDSDGNNAFRKVWQLDSSIPFHKLTSEWLTENSDHTDGENEFGFRLTYMEEYKWYIGVYLSKAELLQPIQPLLISSFVVLSFSIIVIIGIGIYAILLLRISSKEAKEKSFVNLMSDLMPKSLIPRLRVAHAQGEMICDEFNDVVVMFADICGFTKQFSDSNQMEFCSKLDKIYRLFDDMLIQYDIEKIKTIGDAYFACSANIFKKTHTSKDVVNMIEYCFAIRRELELFNQMNNSTINMRYGIHVGSCLAGVLGQKKYSFDLFGDSVNVAARMESNSNPGKIQISSAVYDALVKWECQARYILTKRQVEAKGKGLLTAYFVEPPKGYEMKPSSHEENPIGNKPVLAEVLGEEFHDIATA